MFVRMLGCPQLAGAAQDDDITATRDGSLNRVYLCVQGEVVLH